MKIGVDLGGHTIGFALVDKGIIVKKTLKKTPVSRSPGKTIEVIEETISELSPGSCVDFVGIGVPGLLTQNRGEIVHLINLPGWEGLALPDLIRGQSGLSVEMENDANCSALGEIRAGVGLRHSDFLLLTLGTGIGGAIVTGGKLIRGHRGFAGEFGQIPVISEKNSTSDKFTTLESCFSADTFDDRCREFHLEDIAKLWELRHNPDHSSFWSRSLNVLSYSIAGYIQTLDPEVIVLTGGLTELKNLVEEISTAVNLIITSDFRNPPYILKSSLAENASLLGAASLQNFHH